MCRVPAGPPPAALYEAPTWLDEGADDTALPAPAGLLQAGAPLPPSNDADADLLDSLLLGTGGEVAAPKAEPVVKAEPPPLPVVASRAFAPAPAHAPAFLAGMFAGLPYTPTGLVSHAAAAQLAASLPKRVRWVSVQGGAERAPKKSCPAPAVQPGRGRDSPSRARALPALGRLSRRCEGACRAWGWSTAAAPRSEWARGQLTGGGGRGVLLRLARRGASSVPVAARPPSWPAPIAPTIQAGAQGVWMPVRRENGVTQRSTWGLGGCALEAHLPFGRRAPTLPLPPRPLPNNPPSLPCFPPPPFPTSPPPSPTTTTTKATTMPPATRTWTA